MKSYATLKRLLLSSQTLKSGELGINKGAFRPQNKIPEIPGGGVNRHFPEFQSESFYLSCEVGLKFRKIRVTGKVHSIRPLLLGPSFSKPVETLWNSR